MLRSNKKSKVKQSITETPSSDDLNILKAIEQVNKVSWQVIDNYFKDNPNNLVGHHLDSYNHFIKHSIPSIFNQNNPINIVDLKKGMLNKSDTNNRNSCAIYLGGKTGKQVYFGKPVLYNDNDKTQYMYPNIARLNNMTYWASIYYDVLVEYKYNFNEETKKYSTGEKEFKKVQLGKIPIMLQSSLCILHHLHKDVRFSMGECRYDYGGYFIIDGKERVMVPQETLANNMIFIKTNDSGSEYCHTAEINSQLSSLINPPTRKLFIHMVASKNKNRNDGKQLVVVIPNIISKPIPLFILMRALGIISDKDIIETCLLDMDKHRSLVEYFIPSIHAANEVYTQSLAMKYLSQLLPSNEDVMVVLSDYLLPHVGNSNLLHKAYYLGYMVIKLLKVFCKIDKPSDLDNFDYRRVQTSGYLLGNLFETHFSRQINEIRLKIQQKYYNNFTAYEGENYTSLIGVEDFESNIIENAIYSIFKQDDTIMEDLNRTSWNVSTSQLRKINLSSSIATKTSKLLHNSQWGLIDPVDIPKGNKIGLNKQLAIAAQVSLEQPVLPVVRWFEKYIIPILQSYPNYLYKLSKVFVNGIWIGATDNPLSLVSLFKLYRRNGIIPHDYSIRFHYQDNEIIVYTDAGRLSRPIFYVDRNKLSIYYNNAVREKLTQGTITWIELLSGFMEKPLSFGVGSNSRFYELSEIYPNMSKSDVLKELSINKAVIEYLDTSESQSSLISVDYQTLQQNKYYTHMEIHPSLMFGLMGNQIIYPEHNPTALNSLSCVQTKQAISVYNSNHQSRIENANVLHYGQTPLIKTKYLELINSNELPYGVNVIVAIMSCTGYNSDNSILINEGSVQRGMFLSTNFTLYESHERNDKTQETHFSNFKTEFDPKDSNFDYSQLGKSGMIRENSPVNEKTVLIGRISRLIQKEKVNCLVDTSTIPFKGQYGYVDKTYMNEGNDGSNIAKVRVRNERVVRMGDILASRGGQKGSVGQIIPEMNMPFTSDGVRPDLIINPNSITDQMSIGQILECLFGKVCISCGAYGDGTALSNIGTDQDTIGKMLVEHNYNSTGNQVLYDGLNGTQLEANIFIGPTYYMKLTQKPTKEELQIGEKERDAILSYGMTSFLNESFLNDEFFMAVCNNTGAIAVYNSSKDQFFSPHADGPVQFSDHVLKGNLKNISRFGRSFSLVRVPFAFKQLIQELQVLNIQMRIITSDNVDKLMSLNQCDNLKKLVRVKDPTDLNGVVTSYLRERQTIVSRRGKPKPEEASILNETTNNGVPLVISSYQESVKVIREFLSRNPIMTNKMVPPILSGFNTEQNEMVPQTSGPWNMNEQAVDNTMRYIFNVLFCHCYLLLINLEGIPKLYQLKPTGIPEYYKKLLTQPNSQLKPEELQKLQSSTFRMNQCVIETVPAKEDVAFNKYNKWLNTFINLDNNTSNMPPGVYILNILDAVLLPQYNKLPWTMLAEENNEQSDYLPVLSGSGAKGYLDVPIPNYDIILKNPSTKNTVIPWEQKIEKALFRGTSSGCGTTAETNPRIRLAMMMAEPDASQFLDVGLTSISKEIKFDTKVGFGSTDLQLEIKSPVENPTAYKYIIHIDGNVADYSILDSMATGCVVLKVEGNFLSWVDHLIEDGTHYVGVKGDLSNLMEKISWCMENDEICKKIANEARLFASRVGQKDYVNDSFLKTLWATYKTVSQHLNNTNMPPQLQPQVQEQKQEEIGEPVKEQPEVWQKHLSESQNKYYWINSKTQNVVWDNPEEWTKNVNLEQPQWTNEKLGITTTLNPETSDVIYDNAKSSVVIVKKKDHPIAPILAVEKEKEKEEEEDSEKNSQDASDKSRVIQM